MKKWFTRAYLPYWVLIVCCVALNANTLSNQYALDDEPVILHNMYVQEGVAGIGKIMSRDAFQSLLEQLNAASPLGGGRYRPLSIVSFAVEQQLFGKVQGGAYMEVHDQLTAERESGVYTVPETQLVAQQNTLSDAIYKDNLRIAPVRHAAQLLFYILAIIALFRFLTKDLLPEQPLVAFIAVLLFVFHPVHTEVVANLKSRDEIFSLLFLSLSFSHFFRYVGREQKRDLYIGLGALVLALLSKEYALLFFLLLPIGIMLRFGKTGKEVVKSRWFIGVAVVTLLFLALRTALVGVSAGGNDVHELLNEPYLYATTAQTIATKIYVLGKYLLLLVFPHPLSYDYSYNQIPYVGFGNVWVWVSLLLWVGIVAAGIMLWRRRHVMAFAIAWLLVFFMLVNNLVFDIGATMGERLLFHVSVGFCVVVAWLLVRAATAIAGVGNKRYGVLAAVLVLLLTPAAYATVVRNAEWKNNFILYTHDVRHLGNDAMANSNVGTEYINKGLYPFLNKDTMRAADEAQLRPYADTAIGYFNRALAIYPDFLQAHMNRGICYWHTGQPEKAAADWTAAARHYYPARNPMLVGYAGLLEDKGNAAWAQKDYPTAIHFMSLAAGVDSLNAGLWDNLGGAQYMSGHLPEAGDAFKKALAIDPNLQDAARGLQAVQHQLIPAEATPNAGH